MKITDQTHPTPREFSIALDENELLEIRIAFVHMLGITFYTNNQKARVIEMLAEINETLGVYPTQRST